MLNAENLVTKDEKEMMKKMFREGKSIKEITEKLNRCDRTVYYHLRKMGESVPEPKSHVLKVQEEKDNEAKKTILLQKKRIKFEIGDSVKYSIKGDEMMDSGRKKIRFGKIISVTPFFIAIRNEKGYVECINKNAINNTHGKHTIKKV